MECVWHWGVFWFSSAGFQFGMVGHSALPVDARRCFASTPWGVKWVGGLARLGSRWGLRGHFFLVCFVIVVDNHVLTRLVGLITCDRINSVYTQEAFLSPYLLFIPPPFPIGFHWSPNQTILYHPIVINVSHPVKYWVLYLRVCAFIWLRTHG